jgi:hypothetical protein
LHALTIWPPLGDAVFCNATCDVFLFSQVSPISQSVAGEYQVEIEEGDDVVVETGAVSCPALGTRLQHHGDDTLPLASLIAV